MLEEIKRVCKELLEQKKVDAIVAWRRKNGREVLSIFKDVKDLENLSFSPLSVNNPAKLVMEIHRNYRKLGVIAKGCDAMSIRQLVLEEKIQRDSIFIIGVSCKGVADLRKLKGKKVEVKGWNVFVDERSFDWIFENCLYCRCPTPTYYDVLVGEFREGYRGFEDVEKIEKMDEKERWDFWTKEFSLCIRCHACRSVCPVCYCTECIVDPTNLAISSTSTAEEKAKYPRILGRKVNLKDNIVYHVVRLFHHAGRCTKCGECERACPMGLPLTKLERKLEKIVLEVFGYDQVKETVPFFSKLEMVG